MSITPLSAARIAGELGLAGGTITGGAYAAKYSKEIVVVRQTKDDAVKKKEVAEKAKTDAESARDAAMSQKGNYSNGIHRLAMTFSLMLDLVERDWKDMDVNVKDKAQRLNDCLGKYLHDTGEANCLNGGQADFGIAEALRSKGIQFT